MFYCLLCTISPQELRICKEAYPRCTQRLYAWNKPISLLRALLPVNLHKGGEEGGAGGHLHDAAAVSDDFALLEPDEEVGEHETAHAEVGCEVDHLGT